MLANDKQVGGEHYNKEGEQHWDRMWRLYGRGYFVGCATKYIERYHLKNGIQDLEKAKHFIEKLIELEKDSIVRSEIDYKVTVKEGLSELPSEKMFRTMPKETQNKRTEEERNFSNPYRFAQDN